MIYISLFLTSFIAATLLPSASELMLASLLSQDHAIFLLWLSATTGNVLGSCVNWGLGLQLNRFRDKPWFFFKEKQLASAEKQFQRYGKYSLLFAWLPVVGDPLTLVAGVLKVRFLPFLALVTLGKGLRYGIVIALTLGFLEWFAPL